MPDRHTASVDQRHRAQHGLLARLEFALPVRHIFGLRHRRTEVGAQLSVSCCIAGCAGPGAGAGSCVRTSTRALRAGLTPTANPKRSSHGRRPRRVSRARVTCFRSVALKLTKGAPRALLTSTATRSRRTCAGASGLSVGLAEDRPLRQGQLLCQLLRVNDALRAPRIGRISLLANVATCSILLTGPACVLTFQRAQMLGSCTPTPSALGRSLLTMPDQRTPHA